MKPRIRIDRLLTERGLAESRQKAQAFVIAGQVLADEQKITKPGQQVAPEAEIRILAPAPKYVSRAGVKLEAALENFRLSVGDKVCLDVGSSTGGFTDCLLQHGAAKVYAVDVGTAQLHWKIRQDERVIVRERINARYLDSAVVPEPVQFVSCDVSFISVTLIFPAIRPLLTAEAELVVLAKPQFEVGRGQVGKGGIVEDPELHQQVTEKVRKALQQIGFCRVDEMESPIRGAEGNKEFLLHGSGLVNQDD